MAYNSEHTGAEIDAAINQAHGRNTDTSLDLGGSNHITAAEIVTLKDTTVPAKADKDTDAVVNNLAIFDGDGNPVDSGIASHMVFPSPKSLIDVTPTLDLDFANESFRSYTASGFENFPLNGVSSKFNFTRATTKTYFDAKGIMRTVAAGEMAMDYDPATGECLGLLVEEQRTNICTYSENSAGWSLLNCSVDGSFIAPDGSSGDVFLADGTAAAHRVLKSFDSSIDGNTTVTAGCFVHIPSGSDVIRLFFRVRAGNSAQSVAVNVSGTDSYATFTYTHSGPFGPNAPAAATADDLIVKDCGGGVFRISITSPASSDTTKISMFDVSFSSASIEAAAGTANTKIGIWGLSVEPGAFPTSYIPTTAAAVTRNADVVSMTGVNFSDWYNQSEGTVFVNVNRLSPVNINFTPADIGTGISNFLAIQNNSTNSQWITRTRTTGDNPFATTALLGTDTPAKIAFGMSRTEYTSTINGAAVVTYSPSGTPMYPEADSLKIGTAQAVSTPVGAGHIKQLQYYPRRLTNDELVLLSTP